MKSMSVSFEESVALLRQDISDPDEAKEREINVLKKLLRVNSASKIRPYLDNFEYDWSIPTRVRLAMFFQLARTGEMTAADMEKFAIFLGLFYEEMGAWSTSILQHAAGTSNDCSDQ